MAFRKRHCRRCCSRWRREHRLSAYDTAGVDPQFEFGFGLSYREFEYRVVQTNEVRARADGGKDTYKPGLVRIQVRNTGDVASTETVQVYHGGLPTDRADTPPRQLLGWAQVRLEPGKQKWVEIPIELYTPEHKLAYWDEEWNHWITPTGSTQLFVGASSRDVRKEATLEIRAPKR